MRFAVCGAGYSAIWKDPSPIGHELAGGAIDNVGGLGNLDRGLGTGGRNSRGMGVRPRPTGSL